MDKHLNPDIKTLELSNTTSDLHRGLLYIAGHHHTVN